jgi:hypothetical protein
VARHRFDPIAFVFGLLAVTAAIVVLAGGELSDEGRVLLPVGLIAVGISLLIEVARRPGSSPSAAVPAAGGLDLDAGLAGTGDDRSDLDDLFAPVDDVLSTWDAPAAPPPADATAPPADDDTLVPPGDGDETAAAHRDDTLVSLAPPGSDDDTLVPPGSPGTGGDDDSARPDEPGERGEDGTTPDGRPA